MQSLGHYICWVLRSHSKVSNSPFRYNILVSAMMLYAQCVRGHKPQNYLKSCSKKSDNKINTAHLDMEVKDQAAIAGYETKHTDGTMSRNK